ncbi:MAG: hypothetical protein ACRD2D_03855 [Terriglobales bacterium]
MPKRKQISIWFFIGLLLATYGALILGVSLAEFDHPRPGLVLQNLHFGVSWGAVLLAAGLAWAVCFRPRRAVNARTKAGVAGQPRD